MQRGGLLAAAARWGPSRQFPHLPSFRKLDRLWWGLDLGRAPSIILHLECFWNNRLTLRHQSTCVRDYVFLFACWTNKKTGRKWCNMPAIHQTRLSTCRLTLSLQLLKYVVSNYWNMYATSVPRNTFSPAFSKSSLQPRVVQPRQIQRGLTMQSHQAVWGTGTMSGAQRLLTPSPLHLHENGGNMRYGSASDVRASTGALFVCWAGPLIDRSLPLGRRSMAGGRNPKKASTRNYWKSARKTAAGTRSPKRDLKLCNCLKQNHRVNCGGILRLGNLKKKKEMNPKTRAVWGTPCRKAEWGRARTMSNLCSRTDLQSGLCYCLW